MLGHLNAAVLGSMIHCHSLNDPQSWYWNAISPWVEGSAIWL